MLEIINKLKKEVDLPELAKVLNRAKFGYAIKALKDDDICGSPSEIIDELYFLDRTEEFITELSECK